MTKVYFRDLERLRDRIRDLADTAEKATVDAIQAVETRDAELAQRVIEGDRRIDAMEIEIEEECLKIMALHQPVAQDLRFIVTVLKMNNDLERIGDKAAGMAKKAKRLAAMEKPSIGIDHRGMADKALIMFRNAIHSLLETDEDLALSVCKSDDAINDLEKDHIAKLRDHIGHHPEQIESCGLLIEISSALERIADLATNIAEDAIYMINGEIVRHHVHEMD